ncbi:uncharacterized protein ACDP82_011192 [Pangshura tecta]
MKERRHDENTLQCRVKVKGLQNTYIEVREANRRSSAVPMSCQFYKELDATLGNNPTATMKATVNTLVACMPVESGTSHEEEILDNNVEGQGDPEADDDLEVRDACSQELFSTPEVASQSQLSDLGKAQTGEEAPEKTLGAQPPSLLLPTERLRRIRMWPRRTKEDFLRNSMMQSRT